MIYMYINLKFLLHVITLNDKSKTFSLKELWKSQVWCLGHGSWSIVHHLECPCLRYCFTKLFTFQVHKIHEVPSSIWSPCKTLTLDSWGLGFESYQVWCLGVGIPLSLPLLSSTRPQNGRPSNYELRSGQGPPYHYKKVIVIVRDEVGMWSWLDS